MKLLTYAIAVLVSLAMTVPVATLAKETGQPSGSPKASASVRPTDSSDSDETEAENELRELEKDIEDEDEAIETPEVDVPKDLEDDAAELADEDEDVTKIGVSSETKRVNVTYRLRAKLFGVIEVPYELEARVDAKEGVVTTHGPWWLLFARDHASDVQAALEADPTLLTQTNQGKVLSTIIAILKSISIR